MSKAGIKLLVFLVVIGWMHNQCTYHTSQIGTNTNRTTTNDSEHKETTTEVSKKTEITKKESNSKWSEEKLRQEIVAYSKQLIGSKYKYGGMSPSGFDCSGFTGHVLKEFDISLERTSTSQSKQGKKIKLEDAQPGDLVFFAKSGRIFHVAIIASNKKSKTEIIHSTTSKGVITSDLKNSSYWLPKLHSVRDITPLFN